MSTALRYKDAILHFEDVAVTELAERFGTPLYAYSAPVLRGQYVRLVRALEGLTERATICYALKANANPTIGGLLAALNAGADVVSGGELYLARRMGFPPEKIVFAGVGKTRREMQEALAEGIRAFHVESSGELAALEEVAASLDKVAPVAVRVNPDVDAGTHPYITTGTHANKFGVSPAEALDIVRHASRSPYLRPVGLHVHIGSQLSSVQPIANAVRRVLQLWDLLAAEGIRLQDLDIGGGLGIPYRPGDNPEGPEALAAALGPLLKGRDLNLVVEPGRFIVGPAGALLTTVLYIKTPSARNNASLDTQPTIAIVDAGMNDLLRPALYGAWHPVLPIHETDQDTGRPIDIAGPVCESSDFLARDRHLGAPQPGDVLSIGQAGAYGFSMASQYNARPRPAEVLVEGHQATLIRPRESYEDLGIRG
ncbi:MAG: diaminopimelate decarboxylase [Chloroflexia bacterium]